MRTQRPFGAEPGFVQAPSRSVPVASPQEDAHDEGVAVKVDSMVGGALDEVGAQAKALEDVGYDGAFTAETSHDGFLPLAVASTTTSTIELGTSIAVAFARTPMTLAIVANDLQMSSHGRFVLGLGSQIKPHIERRFSMPWSHPAPRMREFVLAMRAIWSAWHDETKLDFRGDFYTHTLMTPFFSPGPSEFGAPKVWLAAVGERMTEVAGEVADGVIVHAFTTERYLREVTLPNLERGLAKAGKSRDAFEISGPIFIVTGATEEKMAKATQSTKQQIAFYGSTPAYRPVLELHGWGEVGDELNAMSKRGLWVEMADLITDDILDAFAVVAEPDEVAGTLHARYGLLLDRVSFYMTSGADEATTRAAVAALKG
jgi:probable F420-dependent oxidoreductase